MGEAAHQNPLSRNKLAPKYAGAKCSYLEHSQGTQEEACTHGPVLLWEGRGTGRQRYKTWLLPRSVCQGVQSHYEPTAK